MKIKDKLMKNSLCGLLALGLGLGGLMVTTTGEAHHGWHRDNFVPGLIFGAAIGAIAVSAMAASHPVYYRSCRRVWTTCYQHWGYQRCVQHVRYVC